MFLRFLRVFFMIDLDFKILYSFKLGRESPGILDGK